MRWRVLVLAVVGLLLVGGGCGGDDEGGGDADTVVATDTTGTEVPESEGEDAVPLTPGDCQELSNASTAFTQALGAAGSGTDLGDAADAFEAFADRVPGEIRDDYQTLADAFATYAEALREIDLEPGTAPSPEQAAELAQAFASIDQQRVAAASERISTWSSTNCPGG